MVRSSGNPQAMLQQALCNNPNYAQAMQMVRDSGGDARKAFYLYADRMGIDPQQVMNALR